MTNGVVAYIMAGGQGQRMASSGINIPKPLVPIAGVPLLMRALYQLIRFGIVRGIVAVPAHNEVLINWVKNVGIPSAAAGGLDLEVFIENKPLGTLGAVATHSCTEGTLLVINADNLCALDLQGLLSFHLRSQRPMTVASHVYRWQLPYAQMLCQGPKILQYKEKPCFDHRVSSGIYVLQKQILEGLKDNEALDAPELVQRLLETQQGVGVFKHQAPWVDVNQASDLRAAEVLLNNNPGAFERFQIEADREVVGALIESSQGSLLEWRSHKKSIYPGLWDTPGGKVEEGESPEEALLRELREELGVNIQDCKFMASFDDICPVSQSIIRHHTFKCRLMNEPQALEQQELKWFSSAELVKARSLSPVVSRTLFWRRML